MKEQGVSLRSMHEARGARFAASGLVRSYGDPATEYEAARHAAGVIDRSDFAVIRLFGRDPVRMIQGLVTNDVAGADASRAVYATLLTPKGKMLADLRVLRREDDLLLVCDAGARDNVLQTFRTFIPPLFARFEDVTEQYGVIGVHGEEAERVLGAALGAELMPADPLEHAAATGTFQGERIDVVRTSYTGTSGFDVISSAGGHEAVFAALLAAGAKPVGHAALDVLRIEAGRPKWGAELTEDVIPLEADLLDRAISTSKGCYTGQEVIIRVLHRGHVNWHLRGALLGDSPAPPVGAALVHPETGRKVGRITSACASPAHAQTIALCYLRRELELPVEVRLDSPDGATVTLVSLPFPVSDVGGVGDTGVSS